MADNNTDTSRGGLWAKLFALHANLAPFRDERGDIHYQKIASEITKISPTLEDKDKKITDGLKAFFSGESQTIGTWSKARQDVSAQATAAFENGLAKIARMSVDQCLNMARTLKYPAIKTPMPPPNMAEREKYTEALRYVIIDRDWNKKIIRSVSGYSDKGVTAILNKSKNFSLEKIKSAILSPNGYGYKNEEAFFEDAARIKKQLLDALGKSALPDRFSIAHQIKFAFRSYCNQNNLDDSVLANKLGISLLEFKKISKTPSTKNIPLLLKASGCETIYELLAKGREVNQQLAENLVVYNKNHAHALFLVMEKHGDTAPTLSKAILKSTGKTIAAIKIFKFIRYTQGLNLFDVNVILSHYGITDEKALLARGAELEEEIRSYRNAARCITLEQDDNNMNHLTSALGISPATLENYLTDNQNIAFFKHQRLPEVLGFDSPESFLEAGNKAHARLQPLVEIIDGDVAISSAQQVALKNAILDKISSSNMSFQQTAHIVGAHTDDSSFVRGEKIQVGNGLKWVEGFGFETVSDFLSGDESKSVWKRIKPYEAKIALEFFLTKSGTSIETLAESCGIKNLKEQLDAVTPESEGMCFSTRPLMFAMRQAKSESLDAFIAEHLEGHLKDAFARRVNVSQRER